MVMWPKTTWPSAVAGPGRREGAAVRLLGAHRALARAGSRNLPAFQAGRRGLEGVFQEVGLDVGVDRHEVEQDRAAGRPTWPRPRPPRRRFPSSPRGIRSRIGAGTGRRPGAAGPARRRSGALLLRYRGQFADEPGDLGRHQPAVLVAPLVGLALDVQDDPAGLRVAITRPITAHRGRVGPERVRAGTRVGTAPARAGGPSREQRSNRSIQCAIQVGMIILGGCWVDSHGVWRSATAPGELGDHTP